MKREQADAIIKVRQELDFAEKQIGAIQSTRETLAKRPDMQTSLKADLTLYTHGTIMLTRVAVPTGDIDFILEEAENHWETVAAVAHSALENL